MVCTSLLRLRFIFEEKKSIVRSLIKGIHQQKSPWMDGLAMITQCPIDAGNSFLYDYFASESGTQLWHAHSGVHRSNGIVGSLVVREPNDPNESLYDYDLAEHTIVLMDIDSHVAEDKASF